MVGASGWEEGEIPACCLVEIVSVWEGGKVLEMDGGDALHKNVLNTIQMYAGWLKRQISCYVYFTTVKETHKSIDEREPPSPSAHVVSYTPSKWGTRTPLTRSH